MSLPKDLQDALDAVNKIVGRVRTEERELAMKIIKRMLKGTFDGLTRSVLHSLIIELSSEWTAQDYLEVTTEVTGGGNDGGEGT